jgi:hypothetical protein
MALREKIMRRLGLGFILAICASAAVVAPVSAHPGQGSHFACNKVVGARSYCSGFDGVIMGVFAPYGFMAATPSTSTRNAEVCVIDDMYDRLNNNAHVRRYKRCGVGGAQLRGSDIRAQGGFPAGYNGLRFYEVVSVYNREARPIVIGASAIGNAMY